MRCNLVNPAILSDQHLIAEKRELRMIPPLLKKRIDNGISLRSGIPKSFTLGKGHMLFWIDKMEYLNLRFKLLEIEMKKRGFKVNEDLHFDMFYAIMYGLNNDWEPNNNDYDIIKERIKSRLLEKPNWYRYYGKPIDNEWISTLYL